MGIGIEEFMSTGPIWLTKVDWSSSEDQRCVAASLVKGVYVTERERQKVKTIDVLPSSPWWEYFNFKVLQLLKDERDNSIFGIIFKYDASKAGYVHQSMKIPTYIVAFRGTLVRSQRDLYLDFKIFINELNESSRYREALENVENLRKNAKTDNIWLVGHSLGSSIALLVGQHIAREGCSLESLLFNPPFPNIPIEQLKSKRLKQGMHFVASGVRAAAALLGNSDNKFNSSFFELSDWQPSLFVNKNDFICSRFIGYFENRKFMIENGIGWMESQAMQNSFRSLIWNSWGGNSIAAHLIPSVHLVINQSLASNPLEAHELKQWWAQDINCLAKSHLWHKDDF